LTVSSGTCEAVKGQEDTYRGMVGVGRAGQAEWKDGDCDDGDGRLGLSISLTPLSPEQEGRGTGKLLVNLIRDQAVAYSRHVLGAAAISVQLLYSGDHSRHILLCRYIGDICTLVCAYDSYECSIYRGVRPLDIR
jgi:hypothetical protein